MITKNNFTEQDVKKMLNINKFSEMSKEKIMEFVSLIPQLDKEVAMEIIKQFPEYLDFSKIALEQLSKQCERVLEKNGDSVRAIIESYQSILKTLEERLKQENLTEEQKDKIIEKMIEVVNLMKEFDQENKSFLKWVLKFKGEILFVIMIGCLSLFGINAKFKNLPS